MSEHARPWHQHGPPTQAPARPGAVLQRRGLKRMQTILDAAETILAQEGYDAATLKAISERAGIPTASVYHYFLDRHQIDRALMLRHVDALDARVMESLARPGALASIGSMVDAVIDPAVAYYRQNPGCIELRYGQRATGQDELVRAYDDATAKQLHALATRCGLLREDTPVLVMLLAFAVGSYLFDIAFRTQPGTGDDATLGQARTFISLYLEAHAPDRRQP